MTARANVDGKDMVYVGWIEENKKLKEKSKFNRKHYQITELGKIMLASSESKKQKLT